ncbi:MAG: hypothetical protein WC593_03780 [Methanoregula sp.]
MAALEPLYLPFLKSQNVDSRGLSQKERTDLASDELRWTLPARWHEPDSFAH